MFSRMKSGALTLLMLVAAACTDQGPDADVYHLRQLFSTPVPYVDTLGCCIYQGATLALRGPRYDLRLWFQNRINGLHDTIIETGNVQLSGDSLYFLRTSGDFPLSLYGATRVNDTIRLLLGGDGPGAADQFPALFAR